MPQFSITGESESSSESNSERNSLTRQDSQPHEPPTQPPQPQPTQEPPLTEPSPLDHSIEEDEEAQHQDNGEKKILMEKILGQIHKDEDINDDDELDDYITNLEKE